MKALFIITLNKISIFLHDSTLLSYTILNSVCPKKKKKNRSVRMYDKSYAKYRVYDSVHSFKKKRERKKKSITVSSSKKGKLYASFPRIFLSIHGAGWGRNTFDLDDLSPTEI